MLRVFPLNDNYRAEFEKLFKDYYAELDCADDTKHLIDEYIIPDLLTNLLHIDLIESDKQTAGFIIYQIDAIENEWNLKEGLGDIREIYIIRPQRGKGLGKFLLYTAQMKLKELGAASVYCLPCPSAVGFFKVCGYEDTGEYCVDLDCNVYLRKHLNNKCK